MLLMIDNYDSFTFNLVQYFRTLGIEMCVRRNDEICCESIAALQPQALVISPGPCSPNEAGVSLQAVEQFAGRLPILGVCLGHQTIAQVFGARVVRAQQVMHGKTSSICHDGKGVFHQLPAPLTVTRYHSLLVDEVGLPDCLEVSAYCENSQGAREIMALRHKTLPIEGVQFHPESILSQNGLQLLDNFVSRIAGIRSR